MNKLGVVLVVMFGLAGCGGLSEDAFLGSWKGKGGGGEISATFTKVQGGVKALYNNGRKEREYTLNFNAEEKVLKLGNEPMFKLSEGVLFDLHYPYGRLYPVTAP